ncbi:Fur family zinc uptake transcriptional regulator [Albidovulum inexpectatum]|uniref:Fur family zinc uptake transcriptional regulator n=1 Tax=Albidovulum inexpectatum TaxID=196587 RepID=A0A2S5JGE5_9RHOB|nr:Fur family transcriptional regulator [Albidovulum inexpectatum]PPB80543.1 Fur family zinc uptake transcriptional regulator [Albidovulum inexpectatum]
MPADQPNPAVAFAKHDHSDCAHRILDRAEKLSEARGVRLTPVRRRTLEILLESHRAMGAYEVLERLAQDGFGHQPPVAYRALDFLVEHGLAHRIRRLNAFAACMAPGQTHNPVFFICRACQSVAESSTPELRDRIDAAADAIGFEVERANVEALGLCPACADREE